MRWLKRLISRGDPAQLELPLARVREPDRNLHKGGRSFYFFDFDDNVAFLTTPMFLFHRDTKSEIQISSREFARQSAFIGKSGPFADYELDHDPVVGSFRHFRDVNLSWLRKAMRHRQVFVQDLAASLGLPDIDWKGPSWNCFYHAVFNARPVSLITARGHSPLTIERGIDLWVREGHLPARPNYLSIYPVSHPEIKRELGLVDSFSIPHLKQKALRASVEKALRVYGENPHHRFGMSDDDPRNIEWITEEMRLLKNEHPTISFFIIQTHGDQMTKSEIFTDHVVEKKIEPAAQLTLFDE
ncbi:MAG TPA: hypothetical protein PKC28_00110 [Bdellovibrionales bacterium]|nr:hypothetical protein [Bdellovibrionales bacterium]